MIQLEGNRSYNLSATEMVAEVDHKSEDESVYLESETETREIMDPERVWKREDYAVRAVFVQEIVQRLRANPQVDAFADGFNKRFDRHWGKQSSEAQDAYTQNWGCEELWLNPPFSELDQVLAKMEEDHAHGVLILPAWTQKEFYTTALNMTLRHIEFPAGTKMFELYGEEVGVTRWPVIAAYICGSMWRPWQLQSELNASLQEMT